MGVRRIISNSFFRFLSTAVSSLIKIGIIVLLGRSYGPDVLGVWSCVLVINGFCLHIANLGFNGYAVYSIPKREYAEDELISRMLPVSLVASVIAFALSVYILSVLQYSRETIHGTMLVNAALIFDSLTLCVRGIFDGNQKMGWSSAVHVFGDIILLAVVGISLFVSSSVFGVFVAYFVTKAINSCFALFLYWKHYGGFSISGSLTKESWGIVKRSLPFAANNFVTLGSNRFDILLLSYFAGPASVGTYNAAMTLLLRLNMVVKPFVFALFPALTEAFGANRAQYLMYLKTSAKYIVSLAIPTFAFFWVASDKIMDFLYGEKFVESASILRLLSLMILFKFLNPLIASAVTASGNQGKRTVIVTCSFMVNIVLNIILIPQFEALGAVYSSVITEISITAALLSVIMKYKIMELTVRFKDLFHFLLMISVALGLAFLVRDLPLLVVLGVVSSGFVALCLVLRILTVKEMMKYVMVMIQQLKIGGNQAI